MLPLEQLMPFAFATLIFACMPGPAILYMTAQTLAHGPRAGLMAAFGIHLGCYVHIVATALGLAAILDQAPAVYNVIKFAGAAYLVWLGVTMFLGGRRDGEKIANAAPGVLRDSIVVEVLNPKTALFFLTFLPQFIDPAPGTPVWMQFLILGLIVNLALSIADLVAVGIASFALGRVGTGGSSWLVPKACGSILIGLGIALAHKGA
ncbi:LysE family translocator [Pararhizobium sp. DWP1-1-3]|uniref:LysE family translocator n=1 Tax=Pararhizobium sp. DWP1-1-3 TaxID=2804652 RepID=UPI003CECBB72